MVSCAFVFFLCFLVCHSLLPYAAMVDAASAKLRECSKET